MTEERLQRVRALFERRMIFQARANCPIRPNCFLDSFIHRGMREDLSTARISSRPARANNRFHPSRVSGRSPSISASVRLRSSGVSSRQHPSCMPTRPPGLTTRTISRRTCSLSKRQRVRSQIATSKATSGKGK